MKAPALIPIDSSDGQPYGGGGGGGGWEGE